MSFIVIVPARMSSTRLPGKPLADLAGLPMVVRVVRQAALSTASRVVVAADHADIASACAQHGVECLLTRDDHVSGSDRLAEACHLLGLDDAEHVVNVQGDEPLIDPRTIDACAGLLDTHADCDVGTVAHAIDDIDDVVDPNVVKVVCDRTGRAAYFSRAPIPFRRDGMQAIDDFGDDPPLRHVGLYAYRVGYLKRFPLLEPSPLERLESLEQLRVLWHGGRIAVHRSETHPGPGVDTPADLARVRALLAATTPARLP